MARFRSQVREYPGRWIGFHLKWLGDGAANRSFNEYLKTLPMRSFDMQSKTWWVPGDYAALALQSARDLGLLTDPEFKAGSRVVGAGYVDASSSPTIAESLKLLGLGAAAPWWLIEKAYTEWKIRLNDAGAAYGAIAKFDEAFVHLKTTFEMQTEARVKLGPDDPAFEAVAEVQGSDGDLPY